MYVPVEVVGVVGRGAAAAARDKLLSVCVRTYIEL